MNCLKSLPPHKYYWLAIVLMNKKIAAIIATVALFGAALPTNASKILLRTQCHRPQQGYGNCEISISPESLGRQNDTSILDITWQNGETSAMHWRWDIEEMPLIWSSRENQWISATTYGICANGKCLHFSELPHDLEQQGVEDLVLNCLHPTLGESACRVETVAETNGLRIYWKDYSIDHFNFSDVDNVTVWSNAQNDWVEPDNGGICANRECVFFDS
jgi:hypothetical protein